MLNDLNIKNYSHWICGCICVCLYVLSHLSRAHLCNPMDRSLLGSSVHGILPGRILEWVAMPSSRGSDQGIKPLSPALQENSLLLSHGEIQYIYTYTHTHTYIYIYIYIYVHFFSFHVFLTFQCKLRELEKQVRSGPESCHTTAPGEQCRPCWLQGWVGEGDGAGPGGGVLGHRTVWALHAWYWWSWNLGATWSAKWPHPPSWRDVYQYHTYETYSNKGLSYSVMETDKFYDIQWVTQRPKKASDAILV